MNVVSEFVTEKGKEGVGYRGYLYRYGSCDTEGTVRWRCLSSKTCNAALQTGQDKTNPTEKGFHTHPPKPEEVRVRNVRTNLRKRARTETTPIPAVYRTETNPLAASPVVAALMPSLKSVSSSLYR